MSDSSSSGSPPPNFRTEIKPYQFEPRSQGQIEIDRGNDDAVVEGGDNEARINVRTSKEWCLCGRCQDMPTNPECVCCKAHDIREKCYEKEGGYACITDHPGVDELLADAPLEVMWQNYLCYHKDVFPGAPENQKKRLCAYRSMAFWCWSNLSRKERRPLPACLVSKIRAKFPPTDNEEEFAVWQFAGFAYGDENMPAA